MEEIWEEEKRRIEEIWEEERGEEDRVDMGGRERRGG